MFLITWQDVQVDFGSDDKMYSAACSDIDSLFNVFWNCIQIPKLNKQIKIRVGIFNAGNRLPNNGSFPIWYQKNEYLVNE